MRSIRSSLPERLIELSTLSMERIQRGVIFAWGIGGYHLATSVVLYPSGDTCIRVEEQLEDEYPNIQEI